MSAKGLIAEIMVVEHMTEAGEKAIEGQDIELAREIVKHMEPYTGSVVNRERCKRVFSLTDDEYTQIMEARLPVAQRAMQFVLMTMKVAGTVN